MAWFKKSRDIPVLRFNGPIGMATPLRPGISLATAAGAIERAFSSKSAPAVAISINSPGGSPVQSNLIFKRVRALAAEKKKRVFVFCEDVAASGGYLLALAGDEIYADPSSIIGSIGVISAGFGFDKAIDRIGVDRRVYTAGEHKMSLDPFQPEKPEEIARLKSLQKDVHETFMELVRTRRGAKLQDDKDLFTGAIWSGGRAAELGLIDGLADMRTKMRELYGENIRLKVVPMTSGGWLRRRLGLAGHSGEAAGMLHWFAGGEGIGLSDDLISALETRMMWNRFGL